MGPECFGFKFLKEASRKTLTIENNEISQTIPI